MPDDSVSSIATERAPGLKEYAGVSAALAAWSALLLAVTQQSATPAPRAQALIGPIVAMVGLTAVVWLAMVVWRNVAILAGRASARYYVDYASNTPPEWIERPARTFNNLMQVPTLFHVVCVLMLLTGHVDRAQLTLAWLYVAARAVHALVYIALNYVPYRFACWIASCIVLGVIWTRFALASWTSW